VVASEDQFKLLVSMIRDVKPSLGRVPIKLEDSLVENLGLDSLDIMQLARKIRRVCPTFDPLAWTGYHAIHKYAIKSLVDAMGGTGALDAPPNVAGQEAQQDVAR